MYGYDFAGVDRVAFVLRQPSRWQPMILLEMKERKGNTSLRKLTKNKQDIRQSGHTAFRTLSR